LITEMMNIGFVEFGPCQVYSKSAVQLEIFTDCDSIINTRTRTTLLHGRCISSTDASLRKTSSRYQCYQHSRSGSHHVSSRFAISPIQSLSRPIWEYSYL